MPYFEIGRFCPEGYSIRGPYIEGDTVNGQINGRKTTIEVLGTDTVKIGEVKHSKDKGAVIFDPPKRYFDLQRVFVYTNERTTNRILSLADRSRELFVGGQYECQLAECLKVLYQVAYHQVGIEPPRETFKTIVRDLPKFILRTLLP